jgi:hypothetical protein
MWWSRGAMFSVLILACVAFAYAWAATADGLPGSAAPREQLDALRAAGCGEYWLVDGGVPPCSGTVVACAGNPACTVACAGKPCVGCTGPNHQTCEPGGNPTDLCTQTSISCCNASKTCQTTSLGCGCINYVEGSPSGTLSHAVVKLDAPECGG